MAKGYISNRQKNLSLGIVSYTENQEVLSVTGKVGIGTRIDITPYDTLSDGTLSFEGSAGQLFSITNNLTSGSIFSVNDVSGIPSIDVDADGTIQLAPFGASEYVGIGTTNPTAKLDVNGTAKATLFSGSGASLTNIPNGALDNSTVSYGGIQLSLGGSDATPAFDLSDATNYPFTSLTGITTNIVGDTTPQLGGDLDVNGNDITGTGNVNLTGVITATSFDGSLATTNLTGTITNAQLAGSIDNSKLSNSTVSYGGVLLSLGGSDATPAFDLSDATNYPYSSLTGITTDIVGDTTPQLGGDLDLNGNDITGTGNINITGNLNVTGVSTFQDDIFLGDNDVLNFGDGNDLQIFHDGTSSYIRDIGTGGLVFVTDGTTINFNKLGGENLAKFITDGAVELYYDNSKKLETTNTGIAITNGASTSATIAGPDEIIIDPATVGDNTGSVRIKGDLFVDGTTTQINSTSLEIADFIVGIATTATTDLLADGAGIQIGPDNTFLYEYNSGTNPSLKSSENLNVASGKHYQIGETEVLNATTLGSGVVNSSLTSVGTLTGLTVSGDISIADKIIHTGDTNTAIRFPANDTFTVETAGTERLRVTSGGDVGIGTDNPAEKLDIIGDVAIRDTTPTLYLDETDTNTTARLIVSSGDLYVQAGALGSGPATSSGDILFTGYNGTDINAFQVRSGGSYRDIWHSGNDGTGSGLDADTVDGIQASSFLRSDVADTKTGITTFSDDAYFGGQIYLTDTSGGYEKLEIASNDVRFLGKHLHSEFGVWCRSSSTGGDRTTGMEALSDELRLYSNSVEQVRIDTTGQVGIGTDDPQARLHISSNVPAIRFSETDQPVDKKNWDITSLAGNLEFRALNDAGSAANRFISVGRGSTYSISALKFFTGSDEERMRITSTGDVGIGTDNPTSKLHLTDGDLRVENTFGFGATFSNTSTTGMYITLADTGSSAGVGCDNGALTLRAGGNTNEKVRITSAGDVGIGTDAPSQTLDVNGNARFRGAIYDNNNVVGAANSVLTSTGSGVVWAQAGVQVSVGTEAPTSPSQGELWYNSEIGRTFVYYKDGTSNQWVDSAPFYQNEEEPVLTAGKTSQTFTATEGQTTFTFSYEVGYIEVYLNGVRLSVGEYTATNGTSFTLSTGASEGDIVDAVEYIVGIGATGSGGPLTNITEKIDSATYYPIFTTGAGSTVPYITTTSNYFEFTPSTGTLDVNNLTTGNSIVVGSAVTITSSEIDITGGITASGIITATDFNSTSDIALKTNITQIDNPIDKISQINGVSFDWKETQRPSVGVIAQDVEKVLPQLVNGEDTKTVNYNGLIGVLIEAVKEQQEQINTLKEEIAKLKG